MVPVYLLLVLVVALASSAMAAARKTYLFAVACRKRPAVAMHTKLASLS